MKVVIVGGAGVFGARLAELLLRDGHQVWIAGRTRSKTRAAAARLGATPLIADRAQSPEALFDPDPEVVVIDAAGPYQTYGADPYALARICIAERVAYMDLSDDAAFTAGISALDATARAAGCAVLSGVSSVPALSAIAAAELTRGMTPVAPIDTAILPGNRAPRGASVIQSILSQAGRLLALWRGGAGPWEAAGPTPAASASRTALSAVPVPSVCPTCGSFPGISAPEA